MAENGILDYQGMNQAIYRGATSNIIVDTQSMSIEIGAGNSSHTSNLHFECNHDANVASIKLNSNVVTEFSRSKKLIKYPRVALTQNDESGTSGYVASANSEYPTVNDDYAAFRAFNTKGIGYDYVATIGWEPANISTFNSSGTWVGSTSSSVNTTMTLEEGNTIYGEWLQIQLPTKIRLEYVNFLILKNTSHAMAHRGPRAGYILGSNNGTNWTTLKNWSGIVYDTWTAYYDKFYKFDIDKEVDNYQYFRFVWTETAGTSSLSEYASCQELEFWGVPEYDPEAHGTDVIVKSVPNVPNTDWLEVYYDAKSYSTLPDSVNDESGSTNTFNGTIPSGHQITFDDGDIKAFVFPGRDSTTPLQYPDYIQTTLSGWSDNQPHTQSCWFKPTSIASFDQVFGLWDVASTDYEYSAFGIYTDKFSYYHFGSEFQYPYDVSSLIGTWCHISVIHTGYIPDTKVYLNGDLLSGSRTAGSGNTLSLGTAPKLALGKDPGRGNASQEWAFHGSIANYRLFNRALTSDEIYQLYAYQKEYFGHGDLGMTLKAGRLGIGTSEPRAALDVQGDIHGGCPVFFHATRTSHAESTSLQGFDPLVWQFTRNNKGGGYSTITGKFTAPINGYYEFAYGGMSLSATKTFELIPKLNNVDYPGPVVYTSPSNGTHRFASCNAIVYMNAGDTWHLRMPSGDQAMYGAGNHYNFFTGKYLSN